MATGRGRGKALRRLLAGALVLALAPAAAGGQVPPDIDWRTLETPHFRVTFPDGLQGLGREAAARAESAWAVLSEALIDPPRGRIEILLTDHLDVSNGFARVSPYKQITIYARPPVDGFALSHFDDWLELVVTHELAHVFHLDVTGPLGDVLRTVFGRVPVPWPFFPELGTPRWTIEGLATWYESSLTAAGRVRGTYHDMVVRTAVLEDRFEGIDEASGDSPEWPAGQRPYVYGSLFFEDLLERHGRDRMGAFVEAVGDQIVPYRLDAAARSAFGVSFSDAWDEWEARLRSDVAALRARLEARAPLTRPEAVTRDARVALYPAVSPDGSRLVYARSDGDDDTQLRVVSAVDGGEGEELTRTNGTSTFSFLPDGGVLFAQLELTDPYTARSDLYVLDGEGDVERVTRGARLDHPAAGPDGRAVAIETAMGTTRLVSVDLAAGTVEPLGPWDPDVHWAYPAVSPDGRWIAASRWSEGAFFDLVILDREGRLVTRVTEDRALDVAPAFSPDGRWILWSSDRSGVANVLAARIDPATARVLDVRQATNVLTGAFFPSVDPDGRWIHFSGYHADGWEIERVPFRPEAWLDPFPLDARFASAPGGAGDPGSRAPGGEAPDTANVGPVRPYSPLPTLAPRYWEPSYLEALTTGRGDARREILGASYGFETTAADLVGRHDLDVEVLFSTTGGRPSGGAGYRWAGLGNPLLGLSFSQGWDASGPFMAPVAEGEPSRLLYVRERERAVSAGVTALLPTFRRSLSLGLSGGLVWEHSDLLDDRLEPEERFRLLRPDGRLASVRATLSLSTVRGHAFSVGPAEGASLFVAARRRSELDLPDSLASVPGSDRSFDDLIGVVRLFEDFGGPGYANHVLALRVSGGMARGPDADAFHFDVGGNSGDREPLTGFALFGGPSYFFPTRGYVNGERSGRRAWAASAEYRFPLALVNRGLGLAPLHLDRLSGALFFDAANAWGPDVGFTDVANPRRDALTSAGGELVAELLTFFSIPLTLRTGIAVPFAEGRGAEWYLRIGRSF